MTEPEGKTPVEHALDLFVYAPIGLLFDGTSILPQLVERGRSQVSMARVIGKFAVDQGRIEATKAAGRLQDQAAGVLDFLGDSVTGAPAPTPALAGVTRTTVAGATRPAGGTTVAGAARATSTASLAIPDYDGLSASQVVNRLAGLTSAELAAVQVYELANRGRKTILSKVAQLQGELIVVEEACRPAEEADLPRLAELAEAAVAELREGRGGAVWSRREARRPPYDVALGHDLASAAHHVVVGTLDGVVMGYGVARVEDLADGGRLGVVSDLYTEPGCREPGIGEATMNHLVAWCTEQGCFGVDSLALPGDRHTKNFFEAFGLVARAIVVHRPLP